MMCKRKQLVCEYTQLTWCRSWTQRCAQRSNGSSGPGPPEPAGSTLLGAESAQRSRLVVLSTWGTDHRSGRTPHRAARFAANESESQRPRCPEGTLSVKGVRRSRESGSPETHEGTPEKRDKAGLCPPAAERRRRRGLRAAQRKVNPGEHRQTAVGRETQRGVPSPRCRFHLPRQTSEEFVRSIELKSFDHRLRTFHDVCQSFRRTSFWATAQPRAEPPPFHRSAHQLKNAGRVRAGRHPCNKANKMGETEPRAYIKYCK